MSHVLLITGRSQESGTYEQRANSETGDGQESGSGPRAGLSDINVNNLACSKCPPTVKRE